MELSMLSCCLFLVFGIFARGSQCVIDVHFENKEGGFFLKHSGSFRQQQQQLPLSELEGISTPSGDSSVLSIDRFTVFQNSHPISVRAVYGPFSTKQTVPARYIVPDPPPPPPPSSFLTVVTSTNSSSTGNDIKSPESLPYGHHLEVSAHLVNHEIARDSPVLRVLFHMAGIDRSVRKFGKQHSVCVVLHVSFPDQSPLTTSCSPSLDDGQCLAEVTIPTRWWPPLPNLDQIKPSKSPRRVAQVSYYVLEPKSDHSSQEDTAGGADSAAHTRSIPVENCSPHLQIQPLTKIAVVPLVNAKSAYREMKTDNMLFTLVPVAAVYPQSKIFVPVYIRSQLRDDVVGFVIKARAKSGLKIVDAHCRIPEYWNLSFTANSKNTAATVTVELKDIPLSVYNNSANYPTSEENGRNEDRLEEVFSWLLQVEQESQGEAWNDEAHIVWIVHYKTASSVTSSYLSNVAKSKSPSVYTISGTESAPSTDVVNVVKKYPTKAQKRTEKVKHKITARFEIHKDITQAVLPVSKTWELINTALLTGKQVSQPMKIFVVSQSGKIADVTRQSTCHTEDDSVLKVTSSCSSVYVDGSEIRGSSNATILVKYETFTGTASFLVWMPEISELDIAVSDVKLSQIYDWIVPDNAQRFGKVARSTKNMYDKSSEDAESKWQNKKYVGNMNSVSSEFSSDTNKHGSSCKLKYQQASIDIYCRFKAVDHETGRMSYLINRKTWLKITDLVMRGLRIADPHVAALQGRIVTGRNVGRTEVQVVSPLTGRVLGTKEIRVVNDKVSITKLLVNVVSGLQLNIVPDSSGENIYIAETSITRKLSAQYQEGLLDIEVEFSDGSVTAISDVSALDYSISVDSLNPEVVAFAPMLTSLHPRVIAVGEGKGNLRVSLVLPDTCRAEARLKDFVLVTATAYIEVDFFENDYSQKSPMFVQNDGGGVGASNVNNFFMHNNKDKKKNDLDPSSDLQDIISGISPSNDVIKEPAVQARQHQSNKNNLGLYPSGRRHSPSHIAPMEMGMYIILATFSFAIVVFVVSCIVYASKYKPQNGDFQDDHNASDATFLSNGYKPLNQSGGHSVKSHLSQLREPTTTNVHDWVWLGRATLERASGLLVPSISVNDKLRRNKNENWIRITSNPTYTPEPNPDADLNPDSHPAESRRIDSTTYNKKSKPVKEPRSHVNGNQRCFHLPSIPCRPDRRTITEDYKPPVPPHRNIELTTPKPAPVVANPNAAVAANAAENPANLSHRHKHHHHHHHHHHNHHHHHRNKLLSEVSNTSPSNVYAVVNKEDANVAKKEPDKQDADEETRLTFVNSSENFPEFKKANIVGNPMFSLDKEADEEEEDDDGCLGIEDLNLGMDYRQIMEYFDNLKESTA